MVADLREMLENQWVSEIRIDKSRFVEMEYTINHRLSEDALYIHKNACTSSSDTCGTGVFMFLIGVMAGLVC